MCIKHAPLMRYKLTEKKKKKKPKVQITCRRKKKIGFKRPKMHRNNDKIDDFDLPAIFFFEYSRRIAIS